jgi:plastocyanin
MPRLLSLIVLGGVAASLACGDDDVETGPPVAAITITSEGSDFDIEAFAVRAGEEVSVTYDNQDDGVAHNLRVDVKGSDDPQTTTANGPDTQTIDFTVADAGRYTYICDVHPAAMRGTLVVE